MIHPSHPSLFASGLPASDVPLMPVAPAHGGGAMTGAVHRPQERHYDPAGNPIEFVSGSMCDQQAGGDLTGREPETRDDNFMNNSDGASLNRQLQRDMGTCVDDFGALKSEKPQISRGKTGGNSSR